MDFDRFKMRERYSHVRENEHGMLLLDYITEKFSRFDRDGWQEKMKEKERKSAKLFWNFSFIFRIRWGIF